MVSLKEAETVFKALANKRRLHILGFIRRMNEAYVGDIAGDLHLSFKSTSRHLLVLSKAGILENEQRGPRIYYRLSPNMPPAAHKALSLF